MCPGRTDWVDPDNWRNSVDNLISAIEKFTNSREWADREEHGEALNNEFDFNVPITGRDGEEADQTVLHVIANYGRERFEYSSEHFDDGKYSAIHQLQVDLCNIAKTDQLAQDNHGRTPLHMLCYSRENLHRSQNLLLPFINQQAILMQDNKGNTPLHAILNMGGTNGPQKHDLKIIALSMLHYLEPPINLDIKNDNGKTALHLACEFDQAKIVEKLLKLGAHADIRDNDGLTPLMFASGNEAILSLLLQYKANINHQDSEGLSALAHAVRAQRLNTVRVLLFFGARITDDLLVSMPAIFDEDENEDSDQSQDIIIFDDGADQPLIQAVPGGDHHVDDNQEALEITKLLKAYQKMRAGNLTTRFPLNDSKLAILLLLLNIVGWILNVIQSYKTKDADIINIVAYIGRTVSMCTALFGQLEYFRSLDKTNIKWDEILNFPQHDNNHNSSMYWNKANKAYCLCSVVAVLALEGLAWWVTIDNLKDKAKNPANMVALLVVNLSSVLFVPKFLQYFQEQYNKKQIKAAENYISGRSQALEEPACFSLRCR